jgi:hypothetical protein
MVRVDENRPVEARVPAAFTESRTLDSEAFTPMLSSLPKEARDNDLFSSPSLPPTPPSVLLGPPPLPPTPPSVLFGPPPLPPTPPPLPELSPLVPDVAPASKRPSASFEVPNFRRQSPVALIAAVMAIVLGIVLAIWSFSGGSSDPGATSGEHPAKKPW